MSNIPFIKSLVILLVQKGWDKTEASTNFSISATGTEFISVYIYPCASSETETIAAPSLYFGPSTISRAEAAVREHPSVTEYQTGELLSAIKTATELSERLGLSAEFINPITAMAEQLRQNILPKPEAAE